MEEREAEVVKETKAEAVEEPKRGAAEEIIAEHVEETKRPRQLQDLNHLRMQVARKQQLLHTLDDQVHLAKPPYPSRMAAIP